MMKDEKSKAKPMKFNVRAHLLDLLKFKNLVGNRRKKILKAVTEAARKYSNPGTGKVSFNNEAILIVSRK